VGGKKHDGEAISCFLSKNHDVGTVSPTCFEIR
jgi:hypothetical protein